MNTEAEFGAMLPQVKEHVDSPGAGRGRKDPAPEPLEGAHPADTLMWDFWSP